MVHMYYLLLLSVQWDTVTCGGRQDFNTEIGTTYLPELWIIEELQLVLMFLCFTLSLLPIQRWSLSDVMFVTKSNMANAVATVSKQLENVSEALASTKRHLSKRLENLDWKLEEQREMSRLISNDVGEVKSNLNQIGFDIGLIHEMVSGLEGKIELLENKQDLTNSGLWYLCQAAGNIQDSHSSKTIQDVGAKLIEHSKPAPEVEKAKGLQFIVGNN